MRYVFDTRGMYINNFENEIMKKKVKIRFKQYSFSYIMVFVTGETISGVHKKIIDWALGVFFM